MDIIPHSSNVQDLGITMSSDCTFNVHINSLSKRCKNLTGWILRTFISRDKLTMLTLFEALVLSRLDYQVKLRNRNFVTCTLLSLLWYEIKDVPIYRCKSFKFRTLGVKFRYIYCS